MKVKSCIATSLERKLIISYQIRFFFRSLRCYSPSFSSSAALHPWQHLLGLHLSGQSIERSGGQVVRQSHFDLSSGQVRSFSSLTMFISHPETNYSTVATPICTFLNFYSISMSFWCRGYMLVLAIYSGTRFDVLLVPRNVRQETPRTNAAEVSDRFLLKWIRNASLTLWI